MIKIESRAHIITYQFGWHSNNDLTFGYSRSPFATVMHTTKLPTDQWNLRSNLKHKCTIFTYHSFISIPLVHLALQHCHIFFLVYLKSWKLISFYIGAETRNVQQPVKHLITVFQI